MTLTREDFTAFFEATHHGHGPFPWQSRLLDRVLDSGRWPTQIVAPTGSGKTSVIDVHVFAQALTVAKSGSRLPRRLAMVVDRRVLVDDQYEYARRLAAQLARAHHDADGGVLAQVAALLWSMRSPAAARGAVLTAASEPSPLIVGRLRGGSVPARGWRDAPTAASVICATPDMWGSRLLFRGYGSSTRAWPREAGLLAMDSVVVVDEAHLARQLLCTARRVGELATVVEGEVLAPPLQVVETTATPSSKPGSEHLAHGTAVGVDESDLDDALLKARLTNPKPVTLVPVRSWDSTDATGPHVAALADSAMSLLTGQSVHPECPSTVGCFVNTVARAVAVTSELRRRTVDGRTPTVVMVCGQVRPIDLEMLRQRYPGLLSAEGNREVDIVVSTQSLEVGVDLDLAGLVSELASGSALAQRAGRVNRRGLRDNGMILVTVPEGGDAEPAEVAIDAKTHSGPYDAEDLRAALGWLQECTDEPTGLAPWGLRHRQPPAASSHRELFQRPELAEAWYWARTSEDLAAEPQLDLWLSDDFSEDTSVGLVVRDSIPLDSGEAIAMVRAVPPQDHEVFSVPYRTAVAVLRGWHADLEREGASPSVLVARDRDVTELAWRPSQGGQPGERPQLRPGDVLVLDSTVEFFTPTVISGSFSPPVVVPIGDGTPPGRARANDVLEAEATLPDLVWRQRATGGVVHRIELVERKTDSDNLSQDPTKIALMQLASDLTMTTDEAKDTQDRRIVRDWLLTQVQAHQASPMATEAASLLEQSSTHSDVIIQRNSEGVPMRVLVVDNRRAMNDDEVRQIRTRSIDDVLLNAHQRAVADRAKEIGESLMLSDEVVRALELAGVHHDDGKADPRFQSSLGARTAERLLAKSPGNTTTEQARRNHESSGLPPRWRHEQRSVVESWEAIHNTDKVDPLLVARLVGTSHGHGRSGFPHTSDELLLPQDQKPLKELARQLFEEGTWEELIDVTTHRYGAWGCAYLEAILRAADGQVSGEGS